MARILVLTAILGFALCSAELGQGVHGVQGGLGGLGGLRGVHGLGGYDADQKRPAEYSFQYGVNDLSFGTNFGHTESRDGGKTKGQYKVHLPDGRIQTVTYHVDEWGFHAEVSYTGEAQFPKGANLHHGAGVGVVGGVGKVGVVGGVGKVGVVGGVGSAGGYH